MNANTLLRAGVAMAVAGTLSACGATEPELAETRVFFSQLSGTSAVSSASFLAEGAESSAAFVSRQQVSSLQVRISGISVLPLGASNSRGWVEVPVTAPATLDLLDLPSTLEGAVLLAQGDLSVGPYEKLRVRFAQASVVFNEEVAVGTTVYPAGVSISLELPEGASDPGLRVSGLTFNVESEIGADVWLAIDADRTASRLDPGESGGILLRPSLRVGQ